MKPKNVESRIHLGADEGLELSEVHFKGQKVESPKQPELADEFSAFANSPGSQFVMGVNGENRRVTGIPAVSLNAVEHLVAEVCTDRIKPPLWAGISRRQLRESWKPDSTNGSLRDRSY